MNFNYNNLLLIEYVFGTIFFIILFKFQAPYGKFFNEKYGPSINGKLAWFIFESVPLFSFNYFYDYSKQNIKLIFAIMFNLHYINRGLIYPIRMKRMKPNALISGLTAVMYNILNGYLNATQFMNYQYNLYTLLIGILVFSIGMYLNIQADNHLIELKERCRKNEYKLPVEGLFKYVTCGNYFAEIIEWFGWVIATNFAPGSIGFLYFTCCNLIPRAIKTHEWYKSKKWNRRNYPKDRNILIPYLF
jgi:hypothetical protein